MKFSLTGFYRFIILCLSAIMMIFSIIGESPMWLFYSVMLLWLNNTIFACQQIHRRTGILVFQLAFFNFLLGGTFITYLETGKTLYSFDTNILIHSFFSLYISQLFLYFAYAYIEKKPFINRWIKSDRDNNNLLSYIRLVSLIIIAFSFFPYLWEVYDKINFVSNNSYADIYLRGSSNLPMPIQKIAQCFEPSFYIYLGTMPSKRKAMVPILMFVAAAALSVLVGARADFARSIMIIFFYFLARDRWRGLGEKRWIGKKELVVSLALVPILILFLYNIGHERWDNAVDSGSALDGIKDFFVEQGVSVSVIHYSKQYENELPDNMYVLGPVLKLFTENPIVKEIFSFESYGKQTYESAIYSNKFGDAISYIVMPARYFLGYGMGASYIAEVYHSSGYIGLMLINIFYGLVFQIIDRLFGKNTWITAISLLMLYRLIYSPRAQTLDFISNTFNITYIALFIGVIVIAKILLGTKSKGQLNYNNSIN